MKFILIKLLKVIEEAFVPVIKTEFDGIEVFKLFYLILSIINLFIYFYTVGYVICKAI